MLFVRWRLIEIIGRRTTSSPTAARAELPHQEEKEKEEDDAGCKEIPQSLKNQIPSGGRE